MADALSRLPEIDAINPDQNDDFHYVLIAYIEEQDDLDRFRERE